MMELLVSELGCRRRNEEKEVKRKTLEEFCSVGLENPLSSCLRLRRL